MHFIFSDISVYLNFFVSLFALVNPIGMIPIFTTMTNHFSVEERNKTNYITNISVFIILSISLILGNSVLCFFGISMNAFRISGGVLISIIAMSMINGTLIKKNKIHKKEIISDTNIGIVPLAMPLIAGPGAISTTIMWGMQYSGIINMIIGSIIIAFFTFFCWMLFRTAPIIVSILGSTGINIITRIMGLLLMALGIELIIRGISVLFPSLL
ncbi:UPF0056 membrane protein YhcE [Buchnera aphidicola (Thelaxes suberi)]|uniref:YchE family NAAT transporter n=1 Tax=Buchnera aphidicola TaxID=9 RepID=UPI003464D206